MKVLFVSTLYHPHQVGGAEASVRMLAEAAAARGMEAVVVTLAPDGPGRVDTVGGVRVHYLPLANVYFPHGAGPKPGWLRPLWHMVDAWNPVMAARLGAVLDAERPDVVNTHNVQGFSVAAWDAIARRGIPIVQTLHDYYTGCANSAMYRGGRNCATPCAACRVLAIPRRRLSGRPAIVTAVSRRLFQRLRQAGVYDGVADVRYIPNFNPEVRPVAPRDPGDGGPLRLGFFGRLEPLKGLDLMLGTLGRFAADQVVAVVGGTGPPDYVEELRRRFAGPKAAFLGFVAPDAFFARIDALVVPSLWEDPFPRVLHEAMAYGVPVIGARIGGIPEIVEEGRNGFLVPPGDADALERAVRRLLEAPPDWPALAAECRRRAGAFRIEPIFASYRAAWTDAAAGRRAAA